MGIFQRLSKLFCQEVALWHALSHLVVEDG